MVTTRRDYRETIGCRMQFYNTTLVDLNRRQIYQIAKQQGIPPVSGTWKDVMEAIIVWAIIATFGTRHMPIRSQDGHWYYIQDVYRPLQRLSVSQSYFLLCYAYNNVREGASNARKISQEPDCLPYRLYASKRSQECGALCSMGANSS